MPSGSTVVITYNGVNITNKVLWSSAWFESQHNAIPGTFEFTVKDLDHTFLAISGKEVTLTVDGVKLFGGYVLQVARRYPFPAMDTVTVDPTEVPRYWTLRGVDYNILFDKRVLRNTADYLHQIPSLPSNTKAGPIIQQMWDDYIDTPAGFDTTTFVDDSTTYPYNGGTTGVTGKKWAWMQQGTTAREQMADLVQFSGALWYFDADKNLHHHDIEDTEQRWGFSDAPNHGSITTSPAEFQGATIGPREIDATEDGAHLVNDAFVWGGSKWAGAGGTVFAREQNATSQTDHGRWQLAETHFGELGYGIQDGVDNRADLIVNGSPGAAGADQNRGLRYTQWQFRFVWFAHDVPLLSGTPDHLRPGYLSTISLETFGPMGSPLVQLLPLRQVKITFPNLDPTGKGYVKFEGFFGLQPDDPFSLWRYILRNRRQAADTLVAVVDDSSDSTTYGAIAHLTPTPLPNGSATVFTIPFGYITGTTQVFLNTGTGGLLQTPGSDYEESDPINGEITMTVPPPNGSSLLVTCRTLAA